MTNDELMAGRQYCDGNGYCVKRIASTRPDSALEGRVIGEDIPPFIAAASFEYRDEERVVINGCLYLRADFTSTRQPTPRADVALRAVANEALSLAQDLHEGFDYLGTGSNSRWADKEHAANEKAIKRMRAALDSEKPTAVKEY